MAKGKARACINWYVWMGSWLQLFESKLKLGRSCDCISHAYIEGLYKYMLVTAMHFIPHLPLFSTNFNVTCFIRYFVTIGEMPWGITLYECSYQQRQSETSCTCNPLELEKCAALCWGQCSGTHECGTRGVLNELSRTSTVCTEPTWTFHGIWHGKIKEYACKKDT